MKRIGKDKVCYAMSSDNEPVARVAPGESFCVELEDCYSGNLSSPEDKFTKEMWETVNPATGPIYVDGAAVGEVLRVDIQRIETRNYAVMCVERDSGALGKHIEGVETSIIPIEDGELAVSEDVRLPVDPMIGVIGAAPAGAAILNGTPGEHGGNMDCREVTAGASVYLPVNVEGALLSVGDLHALMGDGEVCICGAEVSGEVVLRAWLTAAPLPTPAVETAEDLLFIGSAKELDECERIVLDKAHRFLTECPGLSANGAARIMSLVGQLRVCQVVDPLKTMKFVLPKSVLKNLGMGEVAGGVRRR